MGKMAEIALPAKTISKDTKESLGRVRQNAGATKLIFEIDVDQADRVEEIEVTVTRPDGSSFTTILPDGAEHDGGGKWPAVIGMHLAEGEEVTFEAKATAKPLTCQSTVKTR